MIFQQRRKIQVVSYASAFSHTIKMSNSLDPDQDRHYVGPDLVPNCLQRLSADDRRRLLR